MQKKIIGTLEGFYEAFKVLIQAFNISVRILVKNHFLVFSNRSNI